MQEFTYFMKYIANNQPVTELFREYIIRNLTTKLFTSMKNNCCCKLFSVNDTYVYISIVITRLFEICSTSLVALIRNFPLFCNFPMSMSTNDVEQISNNRVINQESHVYFVKFGINLPHTFFKIFKSPLLCSGRFQTFQKTNSVNLSQISLITM